MRQNCARTCGYCPIVKPSWTKFAITTSTPTATTTMETTTAVITATTATTRSFTKSILITAVPSKTTRKQKITLTSKLKITLSGRLTTITPHEGKNVVKPN